MNAREPLSLTSQKSIKKPNLKKVGFFVGPQGLEP